VQHIWYVAYGSNLSWERFCTYLQGGQPEGSERNYPGCRDATDAVDSFGLLITGGVYFAGQSSGWGPGWRSMMRKPKVRWRRGRI